jgi:lipopolysaccharide export system permease protein
MKTLDRYILRQLLYAFAFFALVFTGVVWLTQAVRLIDTVVSSRQSVAVFGEFSLLVLPQVFLIVLPLAGIGGTLYASNRLYVESELVVMMSAGHGPLGLLRPVAMFGSS